MENYISNPMSNDQWNPQMGDFFSKRVYEEDLLYERRQFRKKIMMSGLITMQIMTLAVVFIYLA